MTKKRRKIKTRPDGSHIINTAWVCVMRRRLKKVAYVDVDLEQAHAGEDMIHQTVLKEIAGNESLTRKQMQSLARASIKTLRIQFPRTCGPWT